MAAAVIKQRGIVSNMVISGFTVADIDWRNGAVSGGNHYYDSAPRAVE